jgi:hypothetical protein
MRYWLCLLAMALSLCARSGVAADVTQVDRRLDDLFGDHKPYQQFLTELQKAVAAEAHERVAYLVSYPLRARIGAHRTTIHNVAQFLARYDALLPPASTAAIRAQSYATVFANAQGVMIGSGQVWFSGVCADRLCSKRLIRIIALNPDAKELH